MGKLGEGGGERWAVGGGRLSFTFLSKNARHSGPSDLLSQQSSAGGLLEIDGGFPSGYCSTVNASSTVIASSTTESACRCSACCGWERGRGGEDSRLQLSIIAVTKSIPIVFNDCEIIVSCQQILSSSPKPLNSCEALFACEKNPLLYIARQLYNNRFLLQGSGV